MTYNSLEKTGMRDSRIIPGSRGNLDKLKPGSPLRLPRRDLERKARLMLKTLRAWTQLDGVQELIQKDHFVRLSGSETGIYALNLYLGANGLFTTEQDYHYNNKPPYRPLYLMCWIRRGLKVFPLKRIGFLILRGLTLEKIKKKILSAANECGVNIDPEVLVVPSDGVNVCRTRPRKKNFLNHPNTVSVDLDGQNLEEIFRSSSGKIYFKPGLCAGKGIFTVSIEPGRFIFESNCGELAYTMQKLQGFSLRKLYNAVIDIKDNRLQGLRKISNIFIRHQFVGYSSLEVKSVEEAVKVARALIRQFKYVTDGYVAQSAIDMPRVSGTRYEFRLIYKKSKNDVESKLVAHYAKASSAKVTGGLATTGYGVTTEYAMEKLWLHYAPSLRLKPQRLGKLVAESIDSLVDATERSFPGHETNSAVDVAAVWDPKHQRFQWWLIELNNSSRDARIGTAGLRANPFLNYYYKHVMEYDI